MTLKNWHKLALGISGLLIAVLFFASGVTPPGPAGEVLRHNQQANIDASPLFYSEVKNMASLEAGVAAMRDSAKSAADSLTGTDSIHAPATAAGVDCPAVSGKTCDPMKGDCR